MELEWEGEEVQFRIVQSAGKKLDDVVEGDEGLEGGQLLTAKKSSMAGKRGRGRIELGRSEGVLGPQPDELMLSCEHDKAKCELP